MIINEFFCIAFQSQISTTSSLSKNDADDASAVVTQDEFGTGTGAELHRLWPQIDGTCTEQLHYARQGVGEGGNGWQLFADEGEMKMYRREQEIDGMVVDPLKACHVVKGVTAREMCHYFFMPEYRNDWESELIDDEHTQPREKLIKYLDFNFSYAGGYDNTRTSVTGYNRIPADPQTDMAG